MLFTQTHVTFAHATHDTLVRLSLRTQYVAPPKEEFGLSSYCTVTKATRARVQRAGSASIYICLIYLSALFMAAIKDLAEGPQRDGRISSGSHLQKDFVRRLL